MSKYILSYLLSLVFGLFSVVSAGIIRVPQEQPSIQAGINAAVNGDTVLVADSTYYENINFMGKAITVASYMILDNDTTHRDSTIINGSQPTNPDIGSVVSFVSGEDTNSVIYGFTITGGTGTLYEYNTRVGGGIYCRNSGARISHNKIIFNSVTNDQFCNGGGIGHFPRSNVKHVIIEHNIIASNTLNSLVGSGGAGANGGGIFLTQGRIIHNKITLNTCSGQTHGIGGGIRVMCEPTSARTFVKISRNTITNNEATSATDFAVGGGIDVTLSNVEIDSNQISHNTVSGIKAYSGGIRMEFSEEISIVKDNIISHNSCISGSGGGLLLAATRGVTIQGNQFINNTAAWGGGIQEQQTIGSIISGNIFDGNIADSDGGGIFSIWDTTTSIYNNLFVNNKAVLSGGGIYLYQNSPAQIVNNTIVADTAGLYGGGIFSGSDSVLVMNNIIWGNSAPDGGQIYTGSTSTEVVYCDVQDTLWPGPGNINADPQFVSGDSLFHLIPDLSNPCVNSGIDSIQINGQWYYCPPDDYEGDERPFPGTPPDVGADETNVPIGIEPEPVSGIPNSYSLNQNYPNPFNPSTTIEFSIPNTVFVTLKIYNMLGQEVATLVSEKLKAGNYNYSWKANELASGVYLYQLKAGNFMKTKKMLLVR